MTIKVRGVLMRDQWGRNDWTVVRSDSITWLMPLGRNFRVWISDLWIIWFPLLVCIRIIMNVTMIHSSRHDSVYLWLRFSYIIVKYEWSWRWWWSNKNRCRRWRWWWSWCFFFLRKGNQDGNFNQERFFYFYRNRNFHFNSFNHFERYGYLNWKWLRNRNSLNTDSRRNPDRIVYEKNE